MPDWLPFATNCRLASAPPSFSQSHRDWMNGDNPPKLLGQRQWLATREGLGERVAYSGTAFLGGLWILVCNERGSRDPAISIEAEPNRNLSGRPLPGRDPAPLQRGTKIVRIGNRNLPATARHKASTVMSAAANAIKIKRRVPAVITVLLS